MLETFRKKDVSRAGSTPAASPFGRMQEALSHPPATEERKPDPLKPDTQQAQSPRADAAPGAHPASKTAESVSRLIVGPDIKLRGAEITDCNTLVVEGRVEASMESRVLQIAEIGEFIGKAVVDSAEIRGRFDGELTVRKQLLICATGHVSGKIRYGRLAIEEGGELAGDIGAIGQAPVSPDNRTALAVKVNAHQH